MARGYRPRPAQVYVLNGEIRQAGSMALLATYVYENGYYNVVIVSTKKETAFKSLGAMRTFFIKHFPQ